MPLELVRLIARLWLIFLASLTQADNNPDLEEIEKQRLAKMVSAKGFMIFLLAVLHTVVCVQTLCKPCIGLEAQALCAGIS